MNFKFLKRIVLFLVSAKTLGFFWDRFSNKLINNIYLRKSNKVIYGADTFEIKKGSKKLILCFHGYLDTPNTFREFFKLPEFEEYDIICPLLPYFGRDLDELDAIDFEVLEAFVQRKIKSYSKEYKKVKVVGHSLSGAIILNLINNHKFGYFKYDFFIINPALFVKSNNGLTKFKLRMRSMFSNYYIKKKFSKCGDTNYAAWHNKNIGMYFNSCKATLIALEYLANIEKVLNQYDSHVNIILSKYDNRMHTDKIIEWATDMKLKLHLFESNNHSIYASEFNRDVANILK